MLIEKWKRENNLFKYATKETSQDSFFSWIIQGINCDYPDRIENYNLAKEFLKEIAPIGLKEYIDDIYEAKIIRQFLGIDILIVLNTKSGKQKYLIIENKTSSNLGEDQKKYVLYYTKLLEELKKPNKYSSLVMKHWSIFYEYYNSIDDIKDNIYCTLIRTNLKYKDKFNLDKDENQIKEKISKKYEFLKDDRFFNKHINFVNTPNKLENLIKIFEKYQNVDKLVKDYYDILLFNLENESLLNNENNVNYINECGLLKEDKTHFRTAYLCISCFNKLLDSPIDINNEKNIDSRIHDRKLSIKIDFDILKENNIFKVCTLDFNNSNSFNNRFITDNSWSYDTKKEVKKLRYIFLFTKQLDEFNKEYYIFRGLYRRFKQIKNDDNTYRIYWDKCSLSSMRKNGKLSINREDIENYIKDIENISE